MREQEWQEHLDHGTGRAYFYNMATHKSVWDDPRGADTAAAGVAGAANPSEEKKQHDENPEARASIIYVFFSFTQSSSLTI